MAADTPGGVLFIIAPIIGVYWDLSPAAIGLIFTVNQFGAGLGYLPAGVMGDKVRRRGLLLSATLGWVAIGCILASVAPSYWALILLLAFAAVGSGAWHPTASTTMIRQMPERRAFALGLHLVGGVLAEVVGPLVAGFLLVIMDWRAVLQLSVIPAVIMAMVLFFRWRSFPESTHQAAVTTDELRSVARSWVSPAGATMLVLVASYSMAFLALLSMTPLFLIQRHGFGTEVVGIVFAGMLLLGGIIAPVAGRYSDLIGRRPIVLAAALIGAIGCVMIAFASNGGLLVISCLVTAGAFMGVRPTLIASALELNGQRESTSLGFIYLAMDGIGALGALLAGFAGVWDLRYALLFAAFCSTVTVVAGVTYRFNNPLPSVVAAES